MTPRTPRPPRYVAALVLAAAAATISVASARAQEADPSHLSLSVGSFHILHGRGSTEGRLEYRASSHWLVASPFVGVMGTDEGSLYGYSGLRFDVPLPGPFVLSPNSAVGLYRQGAGFDLGGILEFRSGVELSYVVAGQMRLSVSFHHMSNAALYDRNPGSESLVLSYSLGSPFGR